jgi:pyridoxine 5'-phosphate synthase PdxJ
MYTHPEEVVEFATRTGCDSLAIAIGTSHGAYKFKPGDLSLKNLAFFHQHIPWLDEVSIGHALICDALYLGLETTIRDYLAQIQNF